MKIAIIEDEKPAAEKLKKAILALRPDWKILPVLYSVKSATNWLESKPESDIIFMDIELTDGLSFNIFDHYSAPCPIIFVTAYDNYWQKALTHNGIDYLLKPLQPNKLKLALEKYENIKSHFTNNINELLQWVQTKSPAPKTMAKDNFLLKRGMEYVRVKTSDMAYFYATDKVVCLMTFEQGKFIMDNSLTDLEGQLDGKSFFRVNRKYIVNQEAIESIKIWSKSKLRIVLNPPVEEDVVISQGRHTAFKEWMGA